MTNFTAHRTRLYNLLGSEVSLSPRMLGLSPAFGYFPHPQLVGRLQNVDHTYAYVETATGTSKVAIIDIFEIRKG